MCEPPIVSETGNEADKVLSSAGSVSIFSVMEENSTEGSRSVALILVSGVRTLLDHY